MSFSQGYEPPSVELNQEEAVLEIFHPAEGVLRKVMPSAAGILILRCRLVPVALTNTAARVQLTSENETLTSVPLYEDASVVFGYEHEVSISRWQAIALEYAGTGQEIREGTALPFQGTELSQGTLRLSSPLYFKPFRSEGENHAEQHATQASGERLITPPGVLNKQVLRPYGGYYKPGARLEDIQQVYYSLTSIQQRTGVRLHSSSNVNPSTMVLPSLRTEESLSLGGALAAGYATISITTDGGDVPMKSFHCEAVAGGVDVRFRAEN